MARRKKKKISELRQEAVAWVFVLPYFLIFFTFTVLSVLISIYFSFTDFNMLQTPDFVGADNYVRLFLNDSVFIKAIGNTFVLALITGLFS